MRCKNLIKEIIFTNQINWRRLKKGINHKNIEIVTKEIKPFGIDLSSGVEKELGIKDNHIINNLMNKINYA